MQNRIEDMYALIAFLRIKPFSKWTTFHTTFVVGFGESKGTDRKFQTLLKAILLRRKKDSEIDGVRIVPDLPPKTIVIVPAVFDREQREFYCALESRMILEIEKYRVEGSLAKNLAYVFVMLLILRQACLHPKLIKAIKKVQTLHDLLESVRSQPGKRKRFEEPERYRKKVKLEVKTADEEVGMDLVKWEAPEIYDKKFNAYLDEEWSSTAKTDELFKILESIRNKDRTEKVIVFSEVFRVCGMADIVYEFI